MKEKEYIPGVYNYCDRWCERCPLADQCFSYQQELESDLDTDQPPMEDIANYVKEQLESATELLHEQAKLHGIDLDNLPDEPIEEPKPIDEVFEENSATLAALSMDYAKMASDWFKHNQLLLHSKEEEINKLLELGAKDMKEIDRFRDAMEIVIWYMHFIAAKTRRAISGKKSFDPDFDEPIQNDYNGSAKIALIAVEKSLLAWQKIFDHLEETADDIIDLLQILAKIKKGIKELFPEAKAFIRPGFDAKKD